MNFLKSLSLSITLITIIPLPAAAKITDDTSIGEQKVSIQARDAAIEHAAEYARLLISREAIIKSGDLYNFFDSFLHSLSKFEAKTMLLQRQFTPSVRWPLGNKNTPTFRELFLEELSYLTEVPTENQDLWLESHKIPAFVPITIFSSQTPVEETFKHYLIWVDQNLAATKKVPPSSEQSVRQQRYRLKIEALLVASKKHAAYGFDSHKEYLRYLLIGMSEIYRTTMEENFVIATPLEKMRFFKSNPPKINEFGEFFQIIAKRERQLGYARRRIEFGNDQSLKFFEQQPNIFLSRRLAVILTGLAQEGQKLSLTVFAYPNSLDPRLNAGKGTDYEITLAIKKGDVDELKIPPLQSYVAHGLPNGLNDLFDDFESKLQETLHALEPQCQDFFAK